MSSEVLSFLGWTFLPDLITTNLQRLYYKLTIRAGDPSPQPGSQRHARHHRRIYIAVIVAYLFYTLYEADWEIRRAGDFYTQLGVDHNVEEKTLQSRFRRLTLLHHPDKLPQSTTPEARAQAEANYVRLQLARDTLVDPAKRFAYDRFGPAMLEWKNSKTIRDFMYIGLQNLVPFYIVTAVFMTILGWMGFGDFGTYWRYLAIATLAVLELHTITRPHFTFLTRIPTLPRTLLLSPSQTTTTTAPPTLNAPFPLSLLIRLINALTNNALTTLLVRQPYLPHQAIRVAHRAALAFFIALARIGPLLAAPSSPSASQPEPSDGSDAALRSAVARAETSISVSCTEASRLLALELVPFRGNEEPEHGAGGAAQGRGERRPYLREKIKEWLVSNSVRSDAEVQEAVGRVIEQRKGAAVSAAGG